MHAEAFNFVKTVARQLRPAPRVMVELGARIVNGTARTCFTKITSYTGVDLVDGEGVTLVADASKPIAGINDGSVDAVLCTETLEHTPDAESICNNAYRMLREGGAFIVTAAGESRPPHACDGSALTDPAKEFYRNVNDATLTAWLGEFRSLLIESSATPGDIYAVAFK